METKMELKADVNKLAYVGSKPGKQRDSDSWFTPRHALSSIRTAMGSIDLDPCSSGAANVLVQATTYWTAEDDCLKQDWRNHLGETVFMNPPYSAALMRPICAKFLENVHLFRCAVVLLNAVTDTQYGRDMMQSASYCIFTSRMAFYDVQNKQKSGNTKGQMLLVWGPDAVATVLHKELCEFVQPQHRPVLMRTVK
jgi:phage N-6-adenine-methyltransferase